MSNNFLNQGMGGFACTNNAYSTSMIPAQYAAGGTRYDIEMRGMQDSDSGAILVIDSSHRNLIFTQIRVSTVFNLILRIKR